MFGADPGLYGPCVDNGYYLMLASLKPGRHTIHSIGARPDGSFSVDVIYHLTVAP